jgi:class 3 adenylate cyclase
MVAGKRLSGQGVATFRLRLVLTPSVRYGLTAHLCSAAFRLYLNGNELASSGRFGKSLSETVSGCRSVAPTFDVTQAENILTLQVANYHHSRGGVRSSFLFGRSEQILTMREQQVVINAFIIGGLCFIMLYSLTSYLVRRKEPAALYLALFCLTCGMWMGMQGPILITIFFPAAPWQVLARLEYLGLFLAPPMLGMLIRALYPREVPRWLIDLCTVTYSALALCALFLSPLLFTRLLTIASSLVIPFSLLCIGIALRATYRRQKESTLFLLGFLPLLIAATYDAILTVWFQQYSTLTPFALGFLILTQALLLSRRSARAQALIEEQTLTLVRLNAAYYRFVPKEFLSLLGKDDILSVQIGDQVQREMTVLFADVRGFTSMSERMSPQENFAFVNLLLGRIGPLIRAHHGFIDKYLGDGIMALFPKRPSDAVHATLQICSELERLNQQRTSRGEPAVRIGIGVHTGGIMLGTVGEPERMDGTVISDVVNTASRLEGLSKIYGAAVVISEQVVGSLDLELRQSVRVLGRVRAKGKEHAITIYEFFAGDPEAVATRKRDSRQSFQAGLGSYQRGDFAAAATELAAVRAGNPTDTAAEYYYRRATESLLQREQRQDAPRSWDGVEIITEK